MRGSRLYVSIAALAITLSAHPVLASGTNDPKIFDRDGAALTSFAPELAARIGRDLPSAAKVQLTIDARVNGVLAEEVDRAVELYGAKAGAALVMEVQSGQILGMVSRRAEPSGVMKADSPATIPNMLLDGVFEFGGLAKLVTLASALDRGTIALDSRIDARRPLQHERFTIRDYHPTSKILSIPEVVTSSSNVATARIAQSLGDTDYRASLARLGLFETPEVGKGLLAAAPLHPRNWSTLHTLTTSFGFGMAVSPLRAAATAATLVNGGRLVQPVLVKPQGATAGGTGQQVISADTSQEIRALMRLNVKRGSASRADAPGFDVGGVTGTSEKVANGRYQRDKLLTAFIGVFPSVQPKYLVLTLVDEPTRSSEPDGYKTAGWTAAPIAGRIVRHIAPILEPAKVQ